MKSLHGKTVYMDFGSAYIHGLTFVRWYRTRNGDGSKDTNKMGVGALVRCDWLAGAPFNRRPPAGYCKGHFIICPYHALHRTYRHARMGIRAIRRPKVGELA